MAFGAISSVIGQADADCVATGGSGTAGDPFYGNLTGTFSFEFYNMYVEVGTKVDLEFTTPGDYFIHENDGIGLSLTEVGYSTHITGVVTSAGKMDIRLDDGPEPINVMIIHAVESYTPPTPGADDIVLTGGSHTYDYPYSGIEIWVTTGVYHEIVFEVSGVVGKPGVTSNTIGMTMSSTNDALTISGTPIRPGVMTVGLDGATITIYAISQTVSELVYVSDPADGIIQYVG